MNENLENLFHNCPILPISIPTNVTFSVVQNSDNYPDGTIAIHQVPGCDIILIFDKGIESSPPQFSIPFIFATQYVLDISNYELF